MATSLTNLTRADVLDFASTLPSSGMIESFKYRVFKSSDQETLTTEDLIEVLFRRHTDEELMDMLIAHLAGPDAYPKELTPYNKLVAASRIRQHMEWRIADYNWKMRTEDSGPEGGEK